MLVAIVAFDEAGSYTPVFDLNSNLLLASVKSAATFGPEITLYNDAFSHKWSGGGFLSGPDNWANAEFSSNVRLQIQWSSTNPPGNFTSGYRWALDLGQLGDEAPRTNESSDLSHWSQWTLAPESLLPAFDFNSKNANHFFYIQARDNDGNITLGIRNFVTVTPVFSDALPSLH